MPLGGYRGAFRTMIFKSSWESGERCKLPSRVWGRAPAEIELGEF